MGPGDLARALCGLELGAHPNLLVGLEQADDAGVVKLTEDIALVQTLDFFTPIVDAPFTFGQIAAANALSDIYAMGGVPLSAMNIVCFPSKTMDIEILREVLRGGLAKIHEADAMLVGGHSIDDPELKYGLSVTGTVHPDRVWTNRGGRPQDLLILTKPLGTGIISTALKQNKASVRSTNQIEMSMATLNRRACEILKEGTVHACTDVTGFGLIGHACEMIEGTELGLVFHADRIPLFADVLRYVEQGLVPGGLKRNRSFRSPMVQASPSISPHLLDALHDPQTSGGLLVAVPPDHASAMLRQMHDAGISDAAIIGELTAHSRGQICIQ